MKQALSLAGAVVLGAVLLVAAYTKLLDPAAFAEQIEAEGLALGMPAAAWAIVFLAFEVTLGVALLCAARHPALLAAATAIVGLFLFLTGRGYVRDLRGIASPAGHCGCFGNLLERSPAEAFFQDLALLVPALALAWWGAKGGGWWRRGVAATAVGLGAAVFAWLSPRLPLDDLATRLKPGAEVARLCAGRGAQRICLDSVAPELSTGRHWVLIGRLDDPALAEAVAGLNRALAGDPGRSLIFLGDFDDEAARRFFWQQAPAFPLRAVPLSLLRPLYRQLPRSFEVSQGKVLATLQGLPPLAGG